ncbi:MAG TPA: extracellular solute-binding protein [Mesotoga infera]|jgi:multiple sugar transport system substrate-binding protein|uniref:ABC-type sugar transport system, periplasmic component n=1 Tax=Mesotoga infera TaxID=1236046 RepID=A0A7Z7LER7_9BACT|nr:extracellular solute-binding protein [Mesotoga infera]NLI07708.1 extracellular solute-binding protein [Thermotogaceae bacterium]HRV02109.1 extracellular solute-binding protein [Mesotoga sp.]SSC12758.1 ABC-type sugar transport system, periplasmic component [Mesotoga infera]HON28593.1 extracellular solute-binding protein [Mesotoga infera]HPD38741.1 extracellular solute-binding protein [Mesotoga infera]
MKKLVMIGLVILLVTAAMAQAVTIVYANWNLSLDIEKKIVEEFMKTHPDIKVEFADLDYGKYEDSLIAAAAAGKLPDVIMIPNIPMALVNDWALDITAMTAKDTEWENIPAPLRGATVYNEKVFAIPSGFYMLGYFVNEDLFTNYNVPQLPYAPDWNTMLSAIRRLTIPRDGVLGIAEEVQIPEWFPATKDPALGYFTWDGEKYNLDHPAFIEGVKIAKQFFDGKFVFDSLPDEQKQQYNAGWYGDVWNQGKIAIRWSGTWDTASFATLPFPSRFIGVPEGKVTVVGDFFVLSKTTKYPEQAYEFAKYITFAKEGILKRLEIDTANQWTSMPLTTEQDVLDEYFKVKKLFPGIDEAFARISEGIVEGVKIVPGYIQSRWTAPTGIKVGDNDNASIGDVIWNSMRGNVNIADYAGQLNKLANEQYRKAIEKIAIMTD